MLTTIGRLPAAVAISLGGVDQGGGIYDVSLAVGAMVRALGGVESSIPANALLSEDGTPILAEDGSYILTEP